MIANQRFTSPTPNRRSRLPRAAAVLLAFSLVLAACSFGDQSGAPENGSDNQADQTEVLGAGQGNTYYVSEQGNDANNGTSQNTPWRYLTTAIRKSQPGDTVFVMNGTYRGDMNNGQAHFVVTKNGTADKWIRFKALPGHSPKLLATNTTAVEFYQSSYIEFSGFEVVGQGFSRSHSYGYGFVANTGHHILIANNEIYGFPVGGIGSQRISQFYIMNNDIHENAYWNDNQGSGISIWRPQNNQYGNDSNGYADYIIGNRVYANENKVYGSGIGFPNNMTDGNGIILDQNNLTGYSGRTLIANNVVFNNGGKGIHVFMSSNADVYNNTTYHNSWTRELTGSRVEIDSYDAKNVRFANNIAVPLPGTAGIEMKNTQNGASYNNIIVNAPALTNDRRVDNVGFVNASTNPDVADFSLQSWSPAIDAGLDLVDDAFGGTTRPAGAKPDIGAYEYVAAQAPRTTTTAAPTTTKAPRTTTTAAPTTTQAPVLAFPIDPNRFRTVLPGANLPTGEQCAEWVTNDNNDWEPKPINNKANQTTGSQLKNSYIGNFDKGIEARVDGNFTGTTDEILRWGACKWGFDENDVRAQAYAESTWRQTFLGDCGRQHETQFGFNECESVGIMQVKGADIPATHPGTFPNAYDSTAFNVDYTLAVRRLCFDGHETWLGPDYAAGDVWGCIGRWFSGDWKQTSGDYIATVKKHKAEKPWAAWADKSQTPTTQAPTPTTQAPTTQAPTTTKRPTPTTQAPTTTRAPAPTTTQRPTTTTAKPVPTTRKPIVIAPTTTTIPSTGVQTNTTTTTSAPEIVVPEGWTPFVDPTATTTSTPSTTEPPLIIGGLFDDIEGGVDGNGDANHETNVGPTVGEQPNELPFAEESPDAQAGEGSDAVDTDPAEAPSSTVPAAAEEAAPASPADAQESGGLLTPIAIGVAMVLALLAGIGLARRRP